MTAKAQTRKDLADLLAVMESLVDEIHDELMPLKEFVKKKCDDNVREAARRLNIPYVSIDRWVNGRGKPDRWSRIRLAASGVRP